MSDSASSLQRPTPSQPTNPVINDFIDLTHILSPTSTLIFPGDPSFSLTPWFTHQEYGVSLMRIEMTTHTGTHMDAPYHFHTDGTTVDRMPLGGSASSVNNLVGKDVWMVDFTVDPQSGAHERLLQPRQRIEWHDIAPYLPPNTSLLKGRIALFHTGWSNRFYDEPSLSTESRAARYFAHPFFSADVAQHLIELGVRAVGMDIPSPDEPRPSTTDTTLHAEPCPPSLPAEAEATQSVREQYPFHIDFLAAGGFIVENMANIDRLANAIRDTAGQDEKRWRVSIVPLKLEGADGSPVRAFASLA